MASPKEWTNSGTETLEIAASPAPKGPVVLEIGPDGRPVRALPFHETATGLIIPAPPRAKVELWSRSELISDKEEAFARAAQYGAFPRIAIGPVVVNALPDPAHPREVPAWQNAPGRFRAYPVGALPVSVRVRNDGAIVWKAPRVRLFAPDNWAVAPAVAPLVDGKGQPLKVLKPGMSALTAFTARIPSGAALGTPSTLVAFLRFEAGGKPVTVHNNIEVTLQDPIDRRYAMTEKGDRFAVRLINRFKPAGLGTATVEVRKPVGTAWVISPPDPVLIKGDAEEDPDARAGIAGLAAPSDQIAVPVVVTLNGYRMGYTPVVCATANYAGALSEKGLKRLAAGSPTSLDTGGLSFADAAAGEHILSLDVPDKFAVSDPVDCVSPTWVTVGLTNIGATRIRLEYDAWGATKPTVAGDMPIAAVRGEDETFSFLLPDARFAGALPGKADLRLIVSGGNATIRKISVTKWNPLKSSPG
jgi:hypothetical protein